MLPDTVDWNTVTIANKQTSDANRKLIKDIFEYDISNLNGLQ